MTQESMGTREPDEATWKGKEGGTGRVDRREDEVEGGEGGREERRQREQERKQRKRLRTRELLHTNGTKELSPRKD